MTTLTKLYELKCHITGATIMLSESDARFVYDRLRPEFEPKPRDPVKCPEPACPGSSATTSSASKPEPESNARQMEGADIDARILELWGRSLAKGFETDGQRVGYILHFTRSKQVKADDVYRALDRRGIHYTRLKPGGMRRTIAPAPIPLPDPAKDGESQGILGPQIASAADPKPFECAIHGQFRSGTRECPKCREKAEFRQEQAKGSSRPSVDELVKRDIPVSANATTTIQAVKGLLEGSDTAALAAAIHVPEDYLRAIKASHQGWLDDLAALLPYELNEFFTRFRGRLLRDGVKA